MASVAALPGRYSKLSWTTAFFMTLFHIGAVWALFQFTWEGLAVFLVTYYISLSLGIGMAYHRLLTHRSYKTSKPVEYFLTICATLALEISFLLGMHAMLGQAPPIHLRSTTAVRRPALAMCQAMSLPPAPLPRTRIEKCSG